MLDVKKADGIYEKSVKVLESVQLDNGGCLATPKGERYPYVYPRDHAIILLGFLDARKTANVRKGLEFVFRSQLKTGAFPQRFDEFGRNASYKPIQLDGSGCILFATAKYLKKTKDKKFYKEHREHIGNAIDYMLANYRPEKQLFFTPNSIHEFPPTEEGLEIWANATCCGALKELSGVPFIALKTRKLCKTYFAKARAGIKKYLWNSHYGSFIKNIRLNESSSVLVDADASEYSVADFGVLKDTDAKVRATVKRIETELWHKELGGICRYPKHEGRNNGGWGPWPHFTLMLARHFIRLGKKQKADQYLQWVVDVSYNLFLPEHISLKKDFLEYVTNFSEAGILREDRLVMIANAKRHPVYKSRGIAYITTPLAWPHAEFIRTWKLYKKKFP